MEPASQKLLQQVIQDAMMARDGHGQALKNVYSYGEVCKTVSRTMYASFP